MTSIASKILAERNAKAVVEIEVARLVDAALYYAKSFDVRPHDAEAEEITRGRCDDLLLQACRMRGAFDRLDDGSHEDLAIEEKQR